MTALRIVAGTANPGLAAAVAAELDVGTAGYDPQRFPDGELHPVLDDVAGTDVYIVQPTAPPVAEHIMELLLLINAARRARAARITAVVPYFGYARQDHRTTGAALGVRVAADAIAHAGADRMVVVDPYCPDLESISPVPVEVLTAIPLLAHALAPAWSSHSVVVAPDMGAGRRCERLAAAMNCAAAVVRKHRDSVASVTAVDVLGPIEGRPAVILDDMICTGATAESAARLLRYHAHDIVVAATHGPLVAGAATRLHDVGVRRIVVTDSVAQQDSSPLLEVCSIAPLLSRTIADLHDDRPTARPSGPSAASVDSRRMSSI